MERDRNSQYTSLIDQREFDYKKELSELLEENERLRSLIKQQQAKLISQENGGFASVEAQRTQISLRSGCDVNQSHVLQINVNDTSADSKRSLNAIRLHCN